MKSNDDKLSKERPYIQIERKEEPKKEESFEVHYVRDDDAHRIKFLPVLEFFGKLTVIAFLIYFFSTSKCKMSFEPH